MHEPFKGDGLDAIIAEIPVHVCWYCDEPITDGAVAAVSLDGDSPHDYAHQSCIDDKNEAASDRQIEDFYGSSSPQTAREREEYERKAS
jgi:hypothetical protein